MSRNVELKARVHDMPHLRALVATLSDTPAVQLAQEDTFFPSPYGRLKLRITSPETGELIAYERPDVPGPKLSSYTRTAVHEPQALKTVLTMALGVQGVVRKQRWLFMVGQTRVHLDQVEGLGHFMELEVVLRPEQTIHDGEQIATALMQRCGIRPEDLLPQAYVDLLSSPAKTRSV